MFGINLRSGRGKSDGDILRKELVMPQPGDFRELRSEDRDKFAGYVTDIFSRGILINQYHFRLTPTDWFLEHKDFVLRDEAYVDGKGVKINFYFLNGRKHDLNIDFACRPSVAGLKTRYGMDCGFCLITSLNETRPWNINSREIFVRQDALI